MWPFKPKPEHWDLIDKTEIPSAWEQAAKVGKCIDRATNVDVLALFERKIIYTFKDRLSGRIKQTTFTN